MTFSELKHEANEASYHLFMYSKYLKKALDEKKLRAKMPEYWFIGRMVSSARERNYREASSGHIDLYNQIMVHLNALFPSKRIA